MSSEAGTPRAVTASIEDAKRRAPIVRQMQRARDEPLQFDALRFQNMSYDDIAALRKELHKRCAISNGVSWRSDVNAARGISSSASGVPAKRAHCEGSELVLHSRPADLKHVPTPRIEPDASLQKRFGDRFVYPGPLDYSPRPVPSRVNSRFVGFLPSSPTKRLGEALDAVAPSPLSYAPHKPLGAESSKASMKQRRVFCTGGSAEVDPNCFATPASYVPAPLSCFDTDRKMPNGATSARFYLPPQMRHPAPGPLDTAAEGVPQYVWRDERDKRWRPVGRADALGDFAPPASVVEALRHRRAATAAKHDRAAGRREPEQAGDAGAASPRDTQQQQRQRSSSPGAAACSHLHHPALLLLNELHKRGLQLARFAATSAGEVHFATKFQIANGFEFKPGISKDFTILNAAKYVRVPRQAEQQQEREEQHEAEQDASGGGALQRRQRELVQKAVKDGADALMAAHPDFVERARGRDFTYCAWLLKVLSSQLAPGDVPVRLTEPEKISGKVFAATVGGECSITAPPIK